MSNLSGPPAEVFIRDRSEVLTSAFPVIGSNLDSHCPPWRICSTAQRYCFPSDGQRWRMRGKWESSFVVCFYPSSVSRWSKVDFTLLLNFGTVDGQSTGRTQDPAVSVLATPLLWNKQGVPAGRTAAALCFQEVRPLIPFLLIIQILRKTLRDSWAQHFKRNKDGTLRAIL